MESQNQKSCVTHYNRYPKIFETVANLKKNEENLNILSFGCSTGEEVRTLKEIYFPKSHIAGVDINPGIITANRIKNADRTVTYYTPVELKTEQISFNIIFCMSVLCLFDGASIRPGTTNKYEFPKFESTVMDIHSMLDVGGLLVIYNSNYFFEDTAIAQNYEKIPVKNVAAGFVPKYKKDGSLYTEHCPLFIYLHVK